MLDYRKNSQLTDKEAGEIDFALPRFKEIACRNIELGFWAK